MVPISVFIFSKEFPLRKLHGSLPPYLILPYLDAHSPLDQAGVGLTPKTRVIITQLKKAKATNIPA